MPTYSTSDPTVLAAYTEATEATKAFNLRVLDAAKMLGKNAGVYRGSDIFATTGVTGLAPLDPNDPPEGWVFLKSKNVLGPARGKAGDPARRWLAGHRPPPSVLDILESSGLPRHDIRGETRDGQTRITAPRTFVHDGALWALFEGTPGFWTSPKAAEGPWIERAMSEYWAAREAYEAAEKAAA